MIRQVGGRIGDLQQVVLNRLVHRTRAIKRGERVAGLTLYNSAFANLTNQFILHDVDKYPQASFSRFLDSIGPALVRSIRILLDNHRNYLLQVVVVVKCVHENMDVPVNSPKRYNKTIGWHDSLMEYVSSPAHFESDRWPVMRTKMHESYEQFVNNGSNWVYDGIKQVYVNAYEFNPQSSKRSHHPLPSRLTHRHCVINVNNADNECFRYAILSRLACGMSAVRHHPQRAEPYNRREIRELADFSSCRYPVGIEQIDEFEARNDTLAINVYMYVAQTDTPRKCRTSMRKEDGYTDINLLLFDDHYMWISHLSRFLNSKAGAHR